MIIIIIIITATYLVGKGCEFECYQEKLEGARLGSMKRQACQPMVSVVNGPRDYVV